ncbi:MAG: protein-glutamate O-methyltransferase family protein, partial [Chloroflexi bacterium]|nr:protein-glutamate O-methyltransferase family protein [Chloroflexota bacterium]
TLLPNLPRDSRARLVALMYAALWGNRYDLSMDVAALTAQARPDERANLLINDSARVSEFLNSRGKRIAYIADNAGTELAMDLALIDFLLAVNFAAQIFLHLKPQPFFVSDAMPRDLDDTLAAFGAYENTRALADRVREYVSEKRLCVTTHWFYPSSLFYFQLPDNLRAQLAAMDFVIIKGDANYRRLLGDAHWNATTSFDYATSYFPAPFVALRTLKAEVIVGLSRERVEELNREDKEWMVNGRRGVIQSNFHHEGTKTQRGLLSC